MQKGAGWWLWKPHLVLKTLLDASVPWTSGVVLWTDAGKSASARSLQRSLAQVWGEWLSGNYVKTDPRPFLSDSLAWSDVVGLRLKAVHKCLTLPPSGFAPLRNAGMHRVRLDIGQNTPSHECVQDAQLGRWFGSELLDMQHKLFQSGVWLHVTSCLKHFLIRRLADRCVLAGISKDSAGH
eukprot:1906889-Amphidinium_carterae.1